MHRTPTTWHRNNNWLMTAILAVVVTLIASPSAFADDDPCDDDPCYDWDCPGFDECDCGWADPCDCDDADPCDCGWGDPCECGWGDPCECDDADPCDCGWGDPCECGWGDPCDCDDADPCDCGWGDPCDCGWGDPCECEYDPCDPACGAIDCDECWPDDPCDESHPCYDVCECDWCDPDCDDSHWCDCEDEWYCYSACGGDPCSDESCPGFECTECYFDCWDVVECEGGDPECECDWDPCWCDYGGDPCAPDCGGDPDCDPDCGGDPCSEWCDGWGGDPCDPGALCYDPCDDSCDDYDECNCDPDPCDETCDSYDLCLCQPEMCDCDSYLPVCSGDINGDGSTNISDMLSVIDQWGQTGPPKPTADVSPPPSGDCVVNIQDLISVIDQWGACEETECPDAFQCVFDEDPNLFVCEPDNFCYCTFTTDGEETVCVQALGSCSDFEICTDGTCPDGYACAVSFCCDDPICMPICGDDATVLGGCCYGDVCAAETTQDYCEAVGGTFLGVGTTCEEESCSVTVDCACDAQYAVGDRIHAIVDNPGSAADVYVGHCGTVVCGKASGTYRLLIEWDSWTQGHDNTGYCECPDDGESAGTESCWWVNCEDIAAECSASGCYEGLVCGSGEPVPWCDDDDDCFCGNGYDGEIYCVPNDSCSLFDACPDGNCPAGFNCIIDTCCSTPICMPPCEAGAATSETDHKGPTAAGVSPGR